MSVNPMAYEAQFFGFTPQTCMLRVYIAFQDYLFEMMLVVERVILKKLEGCPDSKISPFQIRKSTEKFLLFMKERFDHLFSKMEQMLLQLVLNIPKNVLLPEDKVHEQYPYSKEQFQTLQGEIDQLQKQYKIEVSAGQALLAELEEQKKVQAELEKTLQWFDGLENICREHGTSNLKESFAFLTQTSKKLQDILKEVEKKNKRLQKSNLHVV
ncbi:protein MIS12 homolog [Mauremys reevesii]|uniref:protein MIS12 homolog n=1 Tax=Mauremys reevesii TaxID=260615 RepID=UPI00193EF1E8|nr:protein MIS12 homolog [Mauremys reevesii]XP_039363470.1 protein MIS12 homolog [Mauremys reevesii]XP_039363471.1 protein MIS12 homolog [Mauremys reevesii]XP_039363472.1 protein MIS12 homolog [Mauremys reevesii]